MPPWSEYFCTLALDVRSLLAGETDGWYWNGVAAETADAVEAAQAGAFALWCRSPQSSGSKHPLALPSPRVASSLCRRAAQLLPLHPLSMYQGRKRGGAPHPIFFFLREGACLTHSPCIQTRSLPRTRPWGRFLLQVGMGSRVFSQTAVCPCNPTSRGRGRRDLGVTGGQLASWSPCSWVCFLCFA